ncbi:MAG: hemolysin family protein [Acutalibacteraceae bacterium]
MDVNIIFGIIIAVCIMLSAFFSCVETAFSTVSEIRLKNYVDNGNKKAKRALYICENFDKALTAILIMNNIVNLGCSSLATVLCMNLFGNMGAAISTGATTLLVLTFGEIIPKCIAKENSEAVALYSAGILKAVMFILKPLVFLFIQIKSLALSIARIKNDNPEVTEDELKYIIEKIEEQGVLEQQESELVQSALDFDEKTVQEILTPRVDMTAIDISESIETNTEIIMRERYSRIPVYEDNIDNIKGILHTRDYLECLTKGEEPDLKRLIQPAYFVYKSQKLSKLLSEFKRSRLHIAVVTDEYGGTLGIVTMEDLLEEIVGDIWDEDEEIEKTYTLTGKDNHRVSISGDMELDEMLELFDIDGRQVDSDSVTAGGLICDLCGRVPEEGESLEFCGLKITVDKVSDQRIISATVEQMNYTDKKVNE